MMVHRLLGIVAALAFGGCAAANKETTAKSAQSKRADDKAASEASEQDGEDTAPKSQCHEFLDPFSFMKAMNAHPDNSRFTIDADPTTANIENPHLGTECIYDSFSRLSADAQLVVLQELDKNMQYEAMRQLILHSSPEQSPDTYCQGNYTDLVDVILKRRYASDPHSAFLLGGNFSKWLQASQASGDTKAKTIIEGMTKFLPSNLQLRRDYEVFYESNQYNEILSAALVFSRGKIEKDFETVMLSLFNAFSGSHAVWGRDMILPRYPVDLAGELSALEVLFLSQKTKLSAADQALIDEIRKVVGRSFVFKDSEDPSVSTNDAGELKGLAFAVKLNNGTSTEEQSRALKSAVKGILSRANEMATPAKYAIRFFTIAKVQGNPESIVVHIEKKKRTAVWDWTSEQVLYEIIPRSSTRQCRREYGI